MTEIVTNKRPSIPSKLYGETLFIFFLVVLCWLYLFFVTQPILVFDGIGYQQLGQLIFEKGFGAYLHSGPNREPLFPLLVALSMWMGKHWHIAYQYPLRLMGLTSLLVTMLMVQRLMMLLNINRVVSALVILCLGFSPAILNSTLWLWSEFAAYPFVVLIVWWAIKSWKLLEGQGNSTKFLGQVFWHGFMVALFFIGLMCVKAVVQVVILLYLAPYMVRFVSQVKKYGWTKARPWLVFMISVLLVFEGFVQGYEWLNFKANGHYQFTNRGEGAFYSNTARRMEPLTFKRLGAELIFTVDEDLCVRVFGYPDCAFWSARHSDDISDAKAKEFENLHLTGRQMTRYYIHQGLGLMMANPLQALLTMLIEAHEFFFWETPANFVAYPDWMDQFIYNARFNFVLKLITAFFCWAGFVAAAWILLRRRNSGWLTRDEGIVLWFAFSFIFWYAAAYSLFFILDRYAFPVVSLMFVLVSFVLNRLWQKIKLPNSFSKFRLGIGISARMIVAFLFLLLFMIGPLSAHIKYQRQLVEAKSKFMTIEYNRPYFPYFASIVAGRSVPEGDLMEGYHFGTSYNFNYYFSMAIDFFPGDDAAQSLLGYGLYYQGNLENAKDHYEKALKINPDFWWHNYNLAVIYFNKGDFNNSGLLLTKALSLDHQGSLKYIQNSFFYRRIWQFIQDPGVVLANNLNQATENALLMLTVCYLRMNERSQARQLVQQVIATGFGLHKDRWRELAKIAKKDKMQAQELQIETQSVDTLARVRIF